MPEKVLPSDNSDHSLPGRLEESNPVIPPIPVETKPKSRALVISGIVFIIIAAGFFSYYLVNQDMIDSEIMDNNYLRNSEQKLISQYNVGELGSEHTHAAIVLFVNEEQVNFGASQFQLQSRYIHFENHNPYMIHKHATGVPLEILFASIGLNVTSDCIITNAEQEFCADTNNSMTFVINGKYYPDIIGYEIKHEDRILISYGDLKHVTEQLEYIESLEIYDIPNQNRLVPGKDFSV